MTGNTAALGIYIRAGENGYAVGFAVIYFGAGKEAPFFQKTQCICPAAEIVFQPLYAGNRNVVFMCAVQQLPNCMDNRGKTAVALCIILDGIGAKCNGDLIGEPHDPGQHIHLLHGEALEGIDKDHRTAYQAAVRQTGRQL